MEAVEGVGGGAVDAAKRLGDEGDDVIALGNAVGVVASVGGHIAVAGGVVEGWVGGLASLACAQDGPEQGFLGVAECEVVAFGGGGGAAVRLRAAALGGAGEEGGVDFDL